MANPIRVLLIDDEVDFLESVSYWLTSKGYDVTKAVGGEPGLQIVKEGRHDVVFLDVMMPGIDGIETLRRIRTFNKTLPVILVTAATTEDSKFAGAKALGISGLFPKGGSLTQLVEVLQVAIRILPKTHAQSAASSDAPRAHPLQKLLASVRALLGKFTRPTR